MVDNINIAFESGKIPLTIFIDFKKAVDTVDFELLLCGLSDLGIKDNCLRWFRSYLRGISIRVVISDTTSATSRVNCGVPQGCVLEPLLFLVYVNTLIFYLPGVILTAFADNTAITIAEANLLDLTVHANDVLQYLNTFTSLSFFKC